MFKRMQFSKIYASLAGIALLLGASACTDEVQYNPAEPTTTDEVYFSNEQSTTLSIDLDATETYVEISRLRAEDALTVQLSGSSYFINSNKEQESAADVFSIPSSVSFAKGEKTAHVVIGVDFSKIVPARKYFLTLKIEDASASLYGDTEKTFQASYEPWTDWAKLSDAGIFQQAGLWSYNYENDVYYRRSLVDSNLEQYAIGGPFSDFVFDYVFNIDKSKIVPVNGEDCYFVTMETIETPVATSENGNYVLVDFFNFFCEANEVDPVTDYQLAMNFLIENGRSFSYFNPRTGIIGSYQTVTATELEPGYSYGSFMNYLQLGGYADYFIEFSKIYNIVDESGAESVVIEAYKSDDVYSYAYNVIPGNLDDAAIAEAVEAIKADTEATLYTETQRYIVYTPEAQGDYTIVAVGFNQANEEVYHTSYTFTFTTVKADSDWEPAGQAKYTDGFLYPFYNGLGGETWMVDIERHKSNPGLIRMVNPYNSANWPSGKASWDLPGNYYITINMEDPEGVYVEESPMGIMLSTADGSIVAGSAVAELLEAGYPLEQLKQVGYAGKLEDGIITFPGMALTTWWTNDPSSTPSNWDMQIDPYIYNEAGEPIKYNLEAQLQGVGWFELDLNGSSVSASPRKNHPEVMNAQRNTKVLSPIAGKTRKASVNKVIDAQELIKANLKQPRRDSAL